MALTHHRSKTLKSIKRVNRSSDKSAKLRVKAQSMVVCFHPALQERERAMDGGWNKVLMQHCSEEESCWCQGNNKFLRVKKATYCSLCFQLPQLAYYIKDT